jgi:hypothetical protein
MFRGHLDVLTTSGYVEGWAIDLDSASNPLSVIITDMDDREVASGLAHRFREDLALAGMGTGWCAFRLNLKCTPTSIQETTIFLKDAKTGVEIRRRSNLSVLEDNDLELTTISAVLKTDPTVVQSLDSLIGCETMFDVFIKKYGLDAFIRATYVYVLGRPVDPSGLSLYGRLIRKSSLSPFALLRVLADSDEYRSRPRLLSPPTAPGFPYRTHEDR